MLGISEKLYSSWPLNRDVEFMKQKMEPVFRAVYTLFFFVSYCNSPFKRSYSILNRNFFSPPICGLLLFLFILCHCVMLISQT